MLPPLRWADPFRWLRFVDRNQNEHLTGRGAHDMERSTLLSLAVKQATWATPMLWVVLEHVCR